LILHREAGSSEPASCIFLQKKETVPIFLIETAPIVIVLKIPTYDYEKNRSHK
ncbi:MAG: hypothetical protein H6Q66_3012, partial [Firmicutes bacterium]|nr:hypothetical protein [Bacillota bacterium]